MFGRVLFVYLVEWNSPVVASQGHLGVSFEGKSILVEWLSRLPQVKTMGWRRSPRTTPGDPNCFVQQDGYLWKLPTSNTPGESERIFRKQNQPGTMHL